MIVLPALDEHYGYFLEYTDEPMGSLCKKYPALLMAYDGKRCGDTVVRIALTMDRVFLDKPITPFQIIVLGGIFNGCFPTTSYEHWSQAYKEFQYRSTTILGTEGRKQYFNKHHGISYDNVYKPL